MEISFIKIWERGYFHPFSSNPTLDRRESYFKKMSLFTQFKKEKKTFLLTELHLEWREALPFEDGPFHLILKRKGWFLPHQILLWMKGSLTFGELSVSPVLKRNIYPINHTLNERESNWSLSPVLKRKVYPKNITFRRKKGIQFLSLLLVLKGKVYPTNPINERKINFCFFHQSWRERFTPQISLWMKENPIFGSWRERFTSPWMNRNPILILERKGHFYLTLRGSRGIFTS